MKWCLGGFVNKQFQAMQKSSSGVPEDFYGCGSGSNYR